MNKKSSLKMHKGRVSHVWNTSQTLWKGVYAGVSFESARVTQQQIKAAELAIKRALQKNGVLRMRLHAGIAVTKKPAEVRMGKGKGSIKHYVARVAPGAVLFELCATNSLLARRAFDIAASKLPLHMKFITRKTGSIGESG